MPDARQRETGALAAQLGAAGQAREIRGAPLLRGVLRAEAARGLVAQGVERLQDDLLADPAPANG
eukprot:6128542-Lingulodinium_polyedra.AAC.1